MNKFWESNVQHGDRSEQNFIIHSEDTKRTDIKCYHHTHMIITCEVMTVLIILIVLSILQYIGASNHHVLNLHMVYAKFISIMPGAKTLQSQPNNLCLGLPVCSHFSDLFKG